MNKNQNQGGEFLNNEFLNTWKEAALKGTDLLLGEVEKTEDQYLELLEKTARLTEENLEKSEVQLLKSFDKMPGMEQFKSAFATASPMGKPAQKAMIESYLAGAKMMIDTINRPMREAMRKNLEGQK